MKEASLSKPSEKSEIEQRLQNGSWKKGKIGFWCPGDIDFELQKLVDEGVYQDTSKACVALIRKGLKNDRALAPDLVKRVEEVASLLQRSVDVIASQCIREMLDMADSGELPLIIEEIKLRRARSKKPVNVGGKKNSST